MSELNQIIVFSAIWLFSHVIARRKQLADQSLDEQEHAFLDRRYRRRMQTSIILLIIGILIPIGDQWLPWERAPGWFTIYWVVILLATMWVVFRAIGDLALTRFHSRASLARVRQKQRELQEELERIKRGDSGRFDVRGNGHDH